MPTIAGHTFTWADFARLWAKRLGLACTLLLVSWCAWMIRVQERQLRQPEHTGGLHAGHHTSGSHGH